MDAFLLAIAKIWPIEYCKLRRFLIGLELWLIHRIQPYFCPKVVQFWIFCSLWHFEWKMHSISLKAIGYSELSDAYCIMSFYYIYSKFVCRCFFSSVSVCLCGTHFLFISIGRLLPTLPFIYSRTHTRIEIIIYFILGLHIAHSYNVLA